MLDFNSAGRQVVEVSAPRSTMDAAAGFRQAAIASGLLPGNVEESGGRIVRCPATGDKSNQKSGWFVFYSDGVPAGAFGNWKTGETQDWCARAESAMRPEEVQAYRLRMAKAREARDEKRVQLANAAMERAKKMWTEASAAEAHPYLENKGIASFGLKLLRGKLLIPAYDTAGVMRTLQEIDASGEKRFLFGGEKNSHFFLLPGTDKIAVCEGYATAASVHMATGWTVAVAFDAGNLLPVAEAWRNARPAAEIIICGDDDTFTLSPPNPGKAAAERAANAVGGVALFPDFSGLDRGKATDWNDLHALAGLDAVRRQLQGSADYYKVYSCTDILSLPRPNWRIKGVLPETGLATIFGQSRAGKSFLALDMALAVARGVEWFGWETVACPILYVNLESSWGLQGRLASWMQHVCQQPPGNLSFVIDAFDLMHPAHVNGIIGVAPRNGMVIIDTLNRASPTADENSSKDMGVIIKAATAIQQATNGIVLLVTHAGKDTTKGVRGHSSLFAALDTCIEVERKKDSRALKLDKVKEGIDGISHDFQLKTVVIGYELDGSEITSCVVEPVVAQKDTGKPLSPGLQYALESFNKARSAAVGVDVETWREEFYRGHTGDTATAKRCAFNRSKQELVARKIILVEDDFYTAAQFKNSEFDFNDA